MSITGGALCAPGDGGSELLWPAAAARWSTAENGSDWEGRAGIVSPPGAPFGAAEAAASGASLASAAAVAGAGEDPAAALPLPGITDGEDADAFSALPATACGEAGGCAAAMLRAPLALGPVCGRCPDAAADADNSCAAPAGL